jgi:hypothetical protein
VVDLATREGIPGLQRTLGCSRRQAEQTFLLAQRALVTGDVLDEADIPKGTAQAAQRRQASLPAVEPAPFDPVAEAQSRARQIRALGSSEQARALSELASRIATAERNQRNGYPAPELPLLQHTHDLVAGVVA